MSAFFMDSAWSKAPGPAPAVASPPLRDDPETRAWLHRRTVELARLAGRSACEVAQGDYERAKAEWIEEQRRRGRFAR